MGRSCLLRGSRDPSSSGNCCNLSAGPGLLLGLSFHSVSPGASGMGPKLPPWQGHAPQCTNPHVQSRTLMLPDKALQLSRAHTAPSVPGAMLAT